jgi:hypothetical protein
VVDFVLTIAISVSAGASAAIAYFPSLAPWRLLIALGLVVLVGGITWFGHLGRLVFAAMTVAFIVVAAIVLIYGLGATPQPVGTITSTPGHPPVLAVVLAFPVAMALATGVEAPSSAIAQLGQLDNPGRSRFGRITLWLTLAIVGTITLGLAAEAAHLQVGIPPGHSTQIAELARLAAPEPVFAAFQLVTALLLLAAASSSFQAGPGHPLPGRLSTASVHRLRPRTAPHAQRRTRRTVPERRAPPGALQRVIPMPGLRRWTPPGLHFPWMHVLMLDAPHQLTRGPAGSTASSSFPACRQQPGGGLKVWHGQQAPEDQAFARDWPQLWRWRGFGFDHHAGAQCGPARLTSHILFHLGGHVDGCVSGSPHN